MSLSPHMAAWCDRRFENERFQVSARRVNDLECASSALPSCWPMRSHYVWAHHPEGKTAVLLSHCKGQKLVQLGFAVP